MWKTENIQEFELIVSDLLNDPKVLSMRNHSQHAKNCNRFEHSVCVAYFSFLFCRRFGLDYIAAARGGLLHDFSLKDWNSAPKKEQRRKLWRHPHDALKSADGYYELSEKEKDIIVKHMWPLTRPLPSFKESFIVSTADKLCALMEISRLHRALHIQKTFIPALMGV